MLSLTPVVKSLIIINVIFYIGSNFLLNSDVAYTYLSLWFFENPNFQIWQPLTHMFMHSQFSLMHILFNMYALFLFGPPLEVWMRQNRFLFFYISCGLGAVLLNYTMDFIQYKAVMDAGISAGYTAEELKRFFIEGSFPGAITEYIEAESVRSAMRSFSTPAVGASGAVFGVLVGFAMLYPNTPLYLLFIPVPIKAKYLIAAYVVFELYSAISGTSPFGSNIAHWAHIGGAVVGFIIMWFWKRNSFNSFRID